MAKILIQLSINEPGDNWKNDGEYRWSKYDDPVRESWITNHSNKGNVVCLEMFRDMASHISMTTIVVIFPICCYITKPWSSSIILHCSISIAKHHHTNNNPFIKFQPYPKSPINQWSTDQLINWYTDILIHWSTDQLIYWSTDQLINCYRYPVGSCLHPGLNQMNSIIR